MKLDRAELAGTGVAVAFHAALIAALSLSLARVAQPPEPPSMEVELVDEVGLQAAAPTQITTPPPQSQAPEQVETPPPPEPTPMPQVVPTPAPRVEPAPAPRPQPVQRVTPPKPAPAKATPAKPTPTKPVARPRTARIGDDFLKGIADNSRSTAPARAASPVYSAQAQVSIGQSIIQQANRCALRETFLGDGANTVRLKINLLFARTGRLVRPPTVLGHSGDPELVAKYGDLLEDQVQRIFADCAPFRLPPELYDTASGGWKDFTFSYRVR